MRYEILEVRLCSSQELYCFRVIETHLSVVKLIDEMQSILIDLKFVEILVATGVLSVFLSIIILIFNLFYYLISNFYRFLTL